jgi:threonine/homoserine/homoserine lactone efflux protein
VVGNAVGVYLVAASVAFGLGAVVQRSVVIFSVVKVCGACYLMWLGVQAIRHRHGLASAVDAAPAARSAWRSAREGVAVGVANPKAFILFAAILPQFIDRSAGHVPGQMLVLGLVSFVIALISDSLWALAASNVRSWFAHSPKRLGMVGGAGGLAMIGVGLTIAVTGRKE